MHYLKIVVIRVFLYYRYIIRQSLSNLVVFITAVRRKTLIAPDELSDIQKILYVHFSEVLHIKWNFIVTLIYFLTF